ncbi:WD repeat-containing protein 31 [Acropora cervicornis]|uniref:WD repeat-containing protein 31 n=1 Tax=Acropora cervicornis TaxID=6130 RepID=A0AAD9VAM8_ACRCE|nr:WD repeat-containing protein 31 [Acropora cervicornis]
MQPGCFACFESLCMGLKKSKPAGFERYDNVNTIDEVSVTATSTVVAEYSSTHEDSVTCLDSFGPGTCLTGSKDKSVILFDWRQGQQLQRWTGHTRDVTKVKHSGNTFYSSSRDKTIKAWQMGRSDPLLTYEGHRLVVMAIDLNEDGNLMFSGSRDNCVRLWDVTRTTSISEKEVSRNLELYIEREAAVTFHNSYYCIEKPFAVLVYYVSLIKCCTKVWDTRQMQPVISFPAQQYFQTYCDCSSDGQFILTCSNGFNGKGCEATLWDVRAQALVCRYYGHYQTTSACIFLPPLRQVSLNELIATVSHDSTVRIWEKESRECVATVDFSGGGPLTDICAWDDGRSVIVHSTYYFFKLVTYSKQMCAYITLA